MGDHHRRDLVLPSLLDLLLQSARSVSALPVTSMRAWYHPTDKEWLFARLPERLRDAFTWLPSTGVLPGHVWAEDDRTGKLWRGRLPSGPPLLPWDATPVS